MGGGGFFPFVLTPFQKVFGSKLANKLYRIVEDLPSVKRCREGVAERGVGRCIVLLPLNQTESVILCI